MDSFPAKSQGFLIELIGRLALLSLCPEVAKMEVYIESIQYLPVDEKLRLIGRIWDDVTSSSEGVPVPL